jgi:hypothetical protein
LFQLGNDEISLTLLDPVADASRLGVRYVSGCYVYQIEDARLGHLFSGPVYPSDPPPVFDGQGIPEAFRLTLDPVEGQGIIFGNSTIIDDGSRGRDKEVVERCRWRTDHEEVRLLMSTTQHFGDASLNLHREICLAGREITSSTRVQNTGSVPLPLMWYAHPFFPWPADGVCCRFSCDVSLPQNPGFRVNDDGFIERLTEHDWSKGQFIQIDGVQGQSLHAVMRHPTRGEMTVDGDFAMSQMPIWGNVCTVSFEPYLEQTVAPNTELAWSLIYNV